MGFAGGANIKPLFGLGCMLSGLLPTPGSAFLRVWGLVARAFVLLVGGVGVCGGLFVNCIVVVCIFVSCGVLFFVLVFSFSGRSVDAWASRADEGRGGLRYASGSWRASVDPRVSEWGNLARVVSGHQAC